MIQLAVLAVLVVAFGMLSTTREQRTAADKQLARCNPYCAAFVAIVALTFIIWR